MKYGILSIQGQEIPNDYTSRHCNQYYNRSFIKILDFQTGKKVDWKMGAFTQSQFGNCHTDEEIEYLKSLGLKAYYIHPYEGCKESKEAEKCAYKYGVDWSNYTEEDEEPSFDGWVFIGELTEEDIKKANKEIRLLNIK